MKKYILYVLAFLVLHTSASAQFNRLPAADEQYVDNKMQALLNMGIKGTAIGIVVNGEIAYVKGAGLADVANNIPVDNCTLFRTASICKPLTEILARTLDSENDKYPNFSVNDRVRKWLPSFPYAINNPNATVLDLMNHTSRFLSRNWHVPSNLTNYVNNITVFNAQEALKVVNSTAITSTIIPDTSDYSTANYVILGAILEKVSGISYQELVKTRITDPYNMHHYQPEYLWMNYTNKCKGYDDTGSNTLKTLPDISHKLPGGGFLSSAADMALFIKAYTNDDIMDDNGGTWLSHTGSQTGTYTSFQCSKSDSDGVVMFSNTELSAMERTIFNTIRSDIGTRMNGISSSSLVGSTYNENQPFSSFRNMTGTVSSGDKEVYAAYRVTNSNYEVQNGADVRVLADSKIILKPGFRATTGSYFIGSIENVGGSCPLQTTSRNRFSTASKSMTTKAKHKIYPNPSHDFVFVNGEGAKEIAIMNIQGKEIMHVKTTGEQQKLDIRDLQEGIYFVQFISEGEDIDNQKLIVKH